MGRKRERSKKNKTFKNHSQNKASMARAQHRSRRKISGGLYRGFRGKRKFELAGFPSMTKLEAKTTRRSERTLGGNRKISILSTNLINVAQQGKVTKTEILNVVENPANPHLVRRNVMTKGSVVETKLGKVRITSRPGQDSVVNGILLK